MDPETVPGELRVTAQSTDGVIMGLRHESLPLGGVQFHPESFMTPAGPALLQNYLAHTFAQPVVPAQPTPPRSSATVELR